MKVNGNTLRPGNIIEHKERLWIVAKTMHTQPGKGGAYLQAELKDLKNGTKLNGRFRASESVERVRLEEIEQQFLFQEGTDFTFMDNATYDQVTLNRDLIGEPADFLQGGMMVLLLLYQGNPVQVRLPDHIVMEVVEADAVLKGQTASSSYKPAMLSNNRRIMVPPHINAGTRVVVATEDGSYVEKAKD